jgi:hypothetical protein
MRPCHYLDCVFDVVVALLLCRLHFFCIVDYATIWIAFPYIDCYETSHPCILCGRLFGLSGLPGLGVSPLSELCFFVVLASACFYLDGAFQQLPF